VFSVADKQDDGLPDFLEDGPNSPNQKSRSLPHAPLTLSLSGDGSKRKKHESALIRMTTILAAVGAGFDVRLSNTVAIHPNLHTGNEEDRNRKRDSFINNRRDAYLGAVRDSFIEPENDFRSYGPPQGYWYTYHGPQTRHRPSLNLGDGTPGTPGTPGTLSFYLQQDQDDSSGGYNPRTTSHRSSYADSECSAVSSNPPTERTVIFNRQISADSSNYDTPPPSTTGPPPPPRPSQNPQRRSVTFEDDFNPQVHRQSPSLTGGSDSPYGGGGGVSDYEAWYQSPGPPNIPPRRRGVGEGTPQRPTTLDVGSRQGPIQLKYPASSPYARGGDPSPYSRVGGGESAPYSRSGDPAPSPYSRGVDSAPAYTRSGGGSSEPSPYSRNSGGSGGSGRVTTPSSSAPVDTPTPSSTTTNDNTPFFSTRSHLSPGNTPPHITHQKTLLDIDVEGQSQDITKPLVLHSRYQARPTPLDLEKEFLHH
jgi:hypothetical protein